MDTEENHNTDNMGTTITVDSRVTTTATTTEMITTDSMDTILTTETQDMEWSVMDAMKKVITREIVQIQPPEQQPTTEQRRWNNQITMVTRPLNKATTQQPVEVSNRRRKTSKDRAQRPDTGPTNW